MQNISSLLQGSTTIVLGSVPVKEYLDAPIELAHGDFSSFGLESVKSLRELLDRIDPHSEIAEGVGYLVYTQMIANGIDKVASEGGDRIFFVPLSQKESSKSTLLHVWKAKTSNCLSILLFDIDGATSIGEYNISFHGSYKDTLTGLLNFQTLKTHLAHNNKNSFLCLFDLNKFKDINDTYGHAIGDDTLAFIASYLISISGPEEVFYRRSGDEFMMLIFPSDFEYAKSIIEKVETYIEKLGKTNFRDLPKYDLSASFGLVEIHNKGGLHDMSVDTEIRLADLAMYQAKFAKKLFHFISYEDAQSIVRSGNLEERVTEAGKKVSR